MRFKSMDISIVIPNYNGLDLLKRNLPKVIESIKGKSAEIIVVDDASTDESRIYLKEQFPDVLVVKKAKNEGFSSTVNTGVGQAEGEIVVLLNTDIEPHNDFLGPLLAHFKKKEVFAVGCLQESIEASKTVLRGRGIGMFYRGMLIHSRGEVDKQNTLWVSGGAGAFRRSSWIELGGLDELFNPYYWEDIDLSYRAIKSGYKIAFEPKSRVIHRQEIGTIRNTQKKKHIMWVAYRNQFIFFWKNITDKKILIDHLMYLPYHVVKAIFRGDSAFLLGLFKAILLFPTILIKRRRNLLKWRVKDRLIVEAFISEIESQLGDI